MKIFLRIICVMGLIGMIIGLITGRMISVVSNGFCATIMAILSNDY